MPKEKSRSFSIYLLKKGVQPDGAIKPDHGLSPDKTDAGLPEGSRLYILDGKGKDPWWKSYFDIERDLKQVSKGALLFLPVKTRYFALSFGHVAHNLKDDAYEYDFGLVVTLNSVDSKKLRSTDVLEPGASRRQRTQIPNESDLTFFDFDRDSKVLRSLTGKVREDRKDLFKHATGASNLRISSPVKASGLVGLCEKLLPLYESKDYEKSFPDIQNISPVRDPTVITDLNKAALAEVKNKSQTISLAIPDIIEYNDSLFAIFFGEGNSKVYDDISIMSYYEYLKDRDVDINALQIADLKNQDLALADEDGAIKGKRYSIWRSLVFDTLYKGSSYHLSEGNWYKVDDNYIKKLSTYLDPLYIDTDLPEYSAGSEGDYNAIVPAICGEMVCLDKESISPDGYTAVEPCDLYRVANGRAEFYHIKISTLSAQLSHLFNQGTNAIELVKLEDAARDKLKGLLKKKAPNDYEDLIKPIDEEAYRVIFGIVTHKDKTKKSANLPLFSRISLMRNMKALKIRAVPAAFTFIADKSVPKVPGTRKRKKKEAAATGT